MALKKAIELNPKDGSTHALLGGVLTQRNRLDEAEAALKKAIELDPKQAFAHARLDDVLRQKNQCEKMEIDSSSLSLPTKRKR